MVRERGAQKSLIFYPNLCTPRAHCPSPVPVPPDPALPRPQGAESDILQQMDSAQAGLQQNSGFSVVQVIEDNGARTQSEGRYTPRPQQKDAEIPRPQ